MLPLEFLEYFPQSRQCWKAEKKNILFRERDQLGSGDKTGYIRKLSQISINVTKYLDLH